MFVSPFCSSRCPVGTFLIVHEYQHMAIYRLIVRLLRKMIMAFCVRRFQMQINVYCLYKFEFKWKKLIWIRLWNFPKKTKTITKSSPPNRMMKLFMSHTEQQYVISFRYDENHTEPEFFLLANFYFSFSPLSRSLYFTHTNVRTAVINCQIAFTERTYVLYSTCIHDTAHSFVWLFVCVCVCIRWMEWHLSCQSDRGLGVRVYVWKYTFTHCSLNMHAN